MLGGAVLLLAVWVSSTDTIRLIVGTPHGGQSGLSFPNPQSGPTTGRPHKVPQPVGTPLYVIVLEWVILCLLALSLITFLVYAVVSARRNAREARLHKASWEDVDLADIPDVPPAVLEATRRQLFALREGAPRNAIVACWMELESTCRENGFPRAPSETSTEFVSRVLAQFAVSEAAVFSLAAVYREARFSEHDLGEGHREAAITALEQVLSDLQHRAAARTVGAVTAP